jgi:hypothetical protein
MSSGFKQVLVGDNMAMRVVAAVLQDLHLV